MVKRLLIVVLFLLGLLVVAALAEGFLGYRIGLVAAMVWTLLFVGGAIYAYLSQPYDRS
jgi:hypothetical protein